jgi:hypothetical protein
MDLDPDIAIQRLSIGAEKAPLLVIDHFVANADELVSAAASQTFTSSQRHYPGIRSIAPPAYQRLLAGGLGITLAHAFGIEAKSLRFTMCHFSLVTTPAQELTALQRIPHVDSLGNEGLATIHYLFKENLGGTAFYRHRKTGFEYIDEARAPVYFKALEDEGAGANRPGAEYINGDTPLFEQVEKQEGVFNRMLVYRRNSLHSGCIARDFVPNPNPFTGRLSINSFIDLAR